MTAPPPAHNVSPLQFTVPKLVRRQPPRVWLPLAVLMVNTLLLLTVTTAPFHAPDCQIKAPWMTFVPTSMPGFSITLLPVTVPLMVKLPLERYVVPALLVFR